MIGEYTDTKLVGEIKNISGNIDKEFVKQLELLMEKHQVNFVQVFWNRWALEASNDRRE